MRQILLTAITGLSFSALAYAAEEVDKETLAKAIADGEKAYLTCSACHQATGKGIPNAFPPLAKSEWVNKLDNDKLIQIVLLGLQGEVTVIGEKYNLAMAPLGAVLDDQKIADALTYVKNAWENDGGYVSAEEVKTVREAVEGKPMLTAKDFEGAFEEKEEMEKAEEKE